MAQVKVEYWALSRLKVYPHNPKDHPPQQISELKALIREMGFVQPILVDKDAEIIAGHGRLQAATELGLEKLPVIQLKGLTEAQVIALRIADNSVPLRGGWVPDVLQAELDKLEDMNFDIAPFGLDAIELPELEPIEEVAAPARPRNKTTIFVSVKNADAVKARQAIIRALNKEKIEHGL